MAKVFTITQGLENMGAMKTGGQGSVYKGRRIGEIITAIKLLPTPIYSESESDKNYRDFKNEVEKLKKVNREPNPNVVKILSSGLSETGNFPFIEMEYIEGPDLEELLLEPASSVFTIKEAIKVAEHLSNALAHCHKQDVKHGDIKSNNVKLNANTGNYVLLDFGLAVMSDEQRRTSLRKAGAVEFMAPEQNEGETLFQTDVYSFGVIIFELLAGRVPFPLADKGETARNHVRLAHMETLPPDLMSLRKEHMPAIWPNDKKEREMQVPDWLVKLVYTCLKKKPDNRFRNGIELHDFIIHHATHTTNQAVSVVPAYTPATSDREKEQLQYQLSQYKQQMATMQRELDDLKSGQLPGTGVVASTQTYQSSYNQPVNNGVSKTSFIVLLLLTLGLAAFSAYSLLKNNSPSTNDVSTTTNITDTSGTGTLPVEDLEEQRRIQKREEDLAKQRRIDSIAAVEKAKADAAAKQATEGTTTETPVTGTNTETPQTTTEPPRSGSGGVQYMVVSKAYFYNSPDETTRRNAFVVPGNNAIVSAQEEQNDFVYVVFTNTQGQTSKGWLRKKDLQQLSE